MKIIISVLVGIIVLVATFFAFNAYIYNEKQGDQQPALTPKDATYVIDGQVITLKNGIAESEAAPGSASKIVTRYFGNEIAHDIDADGREDSVFILTQQTGGSGTFFYVVGALNKEKGYEGTQGMLLGDRIAPQTTEKGNGRTFIVNYADRLVGESFEVQPSVAKTLWLQLDVENNQFGTIEQDFAGEADPSRMTLDMKTWEWISAQFSDKRVVTPKKKEFTLTFEKGGRFSAATDCNQASGTYSVKDATIAFTNIAMTKMFCEGSQESEFVALLTDASGYHFTSKGQLILDLKTGSGSVVFR